MLMNDGWTAHLEPQKPLGIRGSITNWKVRESVTLSSVSGYAGHVHARLAHLARGTISARMSNSHRS